MFRRTAPHSEARRALITDIEQNRRSWISNGVAALAVSVLGLGVAGSVMVTGTAATTSDRPAATRATATANPTGAVETTVAAGVKQPSAFQRKGAVTSRDSSRPALADATAQQAKDRASALGSSALGEADLSSLDAAQRKAAEARTEALRSGAKDTFAKGEQLVDQRNEQAPTGTGGPTSTGTGDTGAAVTGVGGASLPLTGSFSIAAGFGAVGSWSNYHTGIDFSAPIGTPIHAIAAGVVTHAGPGGGAGGWAGNYVTIRHADGTQTLYAHQSVVSVSQGQQVSAGQVIGHIGMTGRSFGPHVHVELYPQGVEPGDVYRAIDPAPWMRGRGLKV